MSIQFRRGDESKRLASTEVLLAGQPFFEKDTKKLYIGDGSTQLKSLNKIEANDSDAAHLSASNTFTGSNKFEGTVNFSKITEGAISFAGRPSFNAGIELVTGVLSFRDKAATLPSATGTLALADDTFGNVIQFKENTYIDSKCSLTRDVTTWRYSGYGSYCSPGFLVAGYRDGNSSSAAGTTAIGPDGIYKIGTTANRLKFTLPDEAGTLVTANNVVEFPGTSKYLTTAYCKLIREATMWLNGEYGSYVCPGYLVAGYGSGSTTMNNDVVAIGPGGLYRYPSGQTKIKFTLPDTPGTLALTKDIPIKTATLSGTTLSITLS